MSPARRARGPALPPCFAVIGRQNSGKTTLLEGLIAVLKARGLRVGTIKHTAHGFTLDRRGTDSWRHARAGADTVVLVSRRRTACMRKRTREAAPESLAGLECGGMDIVLAEGYRDGPWPRIEVHRAGSGAPLQCRRDPGVIAVVSDAPLRVRVPRFRPAEVRRLARFILRHAARAAARDTVRLFADGRPVPLARESVQPLFRTTLRGMVGGLKGTAGARLACLLVDLGPDRP